MTACGTERILPDHMFRVHGRQGGVYSKERIFELEFILRMKIGYARRSPIDFVENVVTELSEWGNLTR
jgi:hypothetical protein